MSFHGVAIVSVKGIDYIIKFWFITKSKTVYKIKNTDLSEKRGQLRKNKKNKKQNKDCCRDINYYDKDYKSSSNV